MPAPDARSERPVPPSLTGEVDPEVRSGSEGAFRRDPWRASRPAASSLGPCCLTRLAGRPNGARFCCDRRRSASPGGWRKRRRRRRRPYALCPDRSQFCKVLRWARLFHGTVAAREVRLRRRAARGRQCPVRSNSLHAQGRFRRLRSAPPAHPTRAQRGPHRRGASLLSAGRAGAGAGHADLAPRPRRPADRPRLWPVVGEQGTAHSAFSGPAITRSQPARRARPCAASRSPRRSLARHGRYLLTRRQSLPIRRYLAADYRSTRVRAPSRPLIVIPQTLSEITGPVYGHADVRPEEADLTRQHTGEPLGERILVRGARARRGRQAGTGNLGGNLAVQCRRPLHPRRRPASGPARPQFHGRRPRA